MPFIALSISGLALVLLMVSGCGQPTAADQPKPTDPAKALEISAEAQLLVDAAKANLADHLEVSEETITVEEVEEIDFSDTSLGLPEPGQMYAQVITPGYIIRLAAGDTTYTYHAAGERVVRAF